MSTILNNNANTGIMNVTRVETTTARFGQERGQDNDKK